MVNAAYLLGAKPFEENKVNKSELFNETGVYLCTLNAVMLAEPIFPAAFKNTIGWMMIAIVVTFLAIPMLIMMRESFIESRESLKTRYQKFKQKSLLFDGNSCKCQCSECGPIKPELNYEESSFSLKVEACPGNDDFD